MGEPAKTAKGRATRSRIVAAASELVAEQGVAETSLDDVIERAGVSKSQLYHYFEDRSALLRAVITYNTDGVLAGQAPYLGSLDSWKAIRAWFDSLVSLQVERQGCGGCPVGSLVAQLAEGDDGTRNVAAASLERWEEGVRNGLRTMQSRGKLDPTADADALATATLATIQGGLVLTQASRDPGRLATALDSAYAYLRTFATAPAGAGKR
jgi:TetR/AcrR family transcriptional regulator, transcriptional repressor for nem operon